MSKSTYIIELEYRQIQVVAQMLHLCLANIPDYNIATEALDDLVVQASGVYRDPLQHKVYPSVFDAPEDAVTFKEIYYTPLHYFPQKKDL